MISKKDQKDEFNLDIDEMAKAGLHFGRKVSKSHPKMKPFIFGIRNTIHIINLEKTKEKLIEALNFIQNLISENKTILFVGTKIQFNELLKNFAKELNFPYVIERWLGGIFTNFETIKKRCQYMQELEKKLTNQELMGKYTKKEKLKMEKELKKLKEKFEGIKDLEKLPDAIFVLDLKKEAIAVKEAKMKKIKIIGISNTDADPTLADYPIPANNNSISSVSYILNKIKEAILKIKKYDNN